MANDKITAADVLVKVKFFKSLLDAYAARDEAVDVTDPFLRGFYQGTVSSDKVASKFLGQILDEFSCGLEDA